MNTKNEKLSIIIAGLIIGLVAPILVFKGNPVNMGFCIACFIRDTAGGLGLHRAGAVQYIRPEIIGIVLGSLVMALTRKEFNANGGSSPLTRFILGAFVAIGALMFLGCPFRMILRLAGGDFNAIFGLIGFIIGILCGVFFLKKGYSLGKTAKLKLLEGLNFSILQIFVLILLILAPSFIFFSEAGAGPGALHAPIILSLVIGIIVGGIAQRNRVCMVGGIRNVVLYNDWNLLIGFIVIFASALILNNIFQFTVASSLGKSFFKLGFEGQAVAHTDGLWNALGMVLVGFASVLLGGCPLRQLVLAGEGNTDSAITVLGIFAGAAFAHNFALASSGNGPTENGKIAVIAGIIICVIIAICNTFYKKEK